MKVSQSKLISLNLLFTCSRLALQNQNIGPIRGESQNVNDPAAINGIFQDGQTYGSRGIQEDLRSLNVEGPQSMR